MISPLLWGVDLGISCGFRGIFDGAITSKLLNVIDPRFGEQHKHQFQRSKVIRAAGVFQISPTALSPRLLAGSPLRSRVWWYRGPTVSNPLQTLRQLDAIYEPLMRPCWYIPSLYHWKLSLHVRTTIREFGIFEEITVDYGTMYWNEESLRQCGA